MAPLPGSFLTNPLFQVISFGAGTAMGPVLRPLIQDIQNETWSAHAVRPPDAVLLAAGVSQGQVAEASAREWAKQTGYDQAQFDAMVSIANVGPGLSEAFHLWRRKELDQAGFKRALKRLGLEDEWITNLWNVRQDVLDPADLARGIHRGLVPDPGLLQGELPGGVGHVPAYPVYAIDALTEAQAAGFDKDHLGVLVGLQGNPMGAHEAAQAQFRGIIDRNDFLRAIAEGNTRNEWADAIFEQSRQIPTAREFLENALRGYRTLAEAYTGTDRHGMSREDALMVYQNQGRPMAVRQIAQALARGGEFKPEAGEIRDPYLASIVEGNLKPAYYDLAFANRYTYPSFFAIRGLMEAGVLSADEGYQILLEMGWKPDLARQVADHYGVTKIVSEGPRVKAAVTQAITEIRSAFLIGQADESQARGWLGSIGVEAEEIDGILPVWKVMLEVPQKGLTAAQIVKAYRSLPAQWPRSRALDELGLLGYTGDDAATLLDER